MWTFRRLSFPAAVLILLSGAWAQSNTTSLSLEDCILKAMKNNLGLAAELFTPEMARHTLTTAKERFLPRMGFRYGTSNTNSASFSFIDASDQITTEFNDYAGQVLQFLPTGGELSVSLYNYKNDSNQNFLTINPRFGSTLSFNFRQPLLKNFGLLASRREIIVAGINREISESDFKSTLLETLYSVEEAYWNLVFSIEYLKVKQQSLDLARGLLSKNLKEAEVGTMAPIEVLSAQAEVASREADILQAEAQVKSDEDRLRTIVNLSAESGYEGMEILPSDRPADDRKVISLEEALVTAMANRPDLESYKMRIKNSEVELSYAKNQLLPEVNLEASYWSPGVSGTQILYRDNNPLTGEIIGSVPGTSSDALRDALNFRYNNWEIGVSLSIPLNSLLTRGEYSRAKASLDQAMLRLKNQEQQIFLEVRDAVRAVETDFKRIEAYRVAREFAEKKLEAEEKKLKVGFSTNYVVLQYQRDLADARGSELRAIVDYNLAQARLARALGTTLEDKNIKFADYYGDE